MKIKNISKRLSIEIVLLMLSFSVVLLIANTVLLKPLYYNSVESDMKEGLISISSIKFFDETDSWKDEVSFLDSKNPYNITIVYEGKIYYPSSIDFGMKSPLDSEPNNVPAYDSSTNNTQHDNFSDDRPKPDRDRIRSNFEESIKNWKILDDNMKIGEFDDKNSIKLFVAKYTLDNGIEIILTQGIEPILNSVRQANILLAIVTLVFLIISIIVAFQLSTNFTKPIRLMQKHVKNLRQLKFNNTFVIDTGDELEDLNEDINQLSNKLQETLSTLQIQNKQLEKDVIVQRKFISNASHELRTPLSLIKGYSDEISQGFVNDNEQIKLYVAYIANESAKMKRLLNEILELSRLESGRMEINSVVFSIKDLIQDFIDKYTGFIEEHKLNVELDLVDGNAFFDPIRFEQILANYLSNAGKYCDENKKVIIKNEKINGLHRITVSNSGKSIKKEDIDYIWDGFYKTDISSQESYDSYGLGLSIVRAIQELTHCDYGFYHKNNFNSFWFDVISSTDELHDNEPIN